MSEAATGEGGREEVAAGSAEFAVRPLCKTAVKVWVLNPLTGKNVGVKTHTSPTGATPLVEMRSAVMG